jgi:hypothetical protein
MTARFYTVKRDGMSFALRSMSNITVEDDSKKQQQYCRNFIDLTSDCNLGSKEK